MYERLLQQTKTNKEFKKKQAKMGGFGEFK